MDNERAVEVSAIVGGDRARLNEGRLHAALAQRAASLSPPEFSKSELFQSFFVGGFECSSHRRRDWRRLDLLASTCSGIDVNAGADYRALAQHGISTVRDGLRWQLIERVPGHYDWSSFLPMLHAARQTGTQVLWDLLHWGWRSSRHLEPRIRHTVRPVCQSLPSRARRNKPISLLSSVES